MSASSGQLLPYRIGQGYDIHRTGADCPLVLGGVVIPAASGLFGHSDADPLLHAIIDALLGAAALGDIGAHFPPGDERWRGADSRVLLQQAVKLVQEAGYTIGNIDTTVIAEQPRIGPHVPAIRAAIAAAAGVAVSQVSVKGKTNEGLDAVGRGEAIAAQAVVILEVSPAGG